MKKKTKITAALALVATALGGGTIWSLSEDKPAVNAQFSAPNPDFDQDVPATGGVDVALSSPSAVAAAYARATKKTAGADTQDYAFSSKKTIDPVQDSFTFAYDETVTPSAPLTFETPALTITTLDLGKDFSACCNTPVNVNPGFGPGIIIGGGQTPGTPGVTPGVPEPGTWAMMIAGFGMVGAAMRNRNAKTKKTAGLSA